MGLADPLKKVYSSASYKSTTDQDLSYEKSQEFILKNKKLLENRLVMARYWVIIVIVYYLFRMFLVILPRFERRTSFEQATIIVQMVGFGLIILGTIWSFYRHLSIITVLLYMQSLLLALSNYNNYDAETNANYEGLNMLSTVFSVMFSILNCYLASLVITDFRVKGASTFFIFGVLGFIMVDTNFNWDDTT